MPEISTTLATQYLKLAIWHPRERALTALALRTAAEAGTSCTSLLREVWPTLHGRLQDGHAVVVAENLTHYGEFAAVGFLLMQRSRRFHWYARLRLLNQYVTSRFERRVINPVENYTAVEHMVQRLCRSSSLHVRSAIEIVLQDLVLQATASLMSAFPDADMDARVRIVRLLAAAMRSEHAASATPRPDLLQLVRGAARDAKAELRAAATRAMLDWPVCEARQELLLLLLDERLEVAQEASDAIMLGALIHRWPADEFTSALLQLNLPESSGHLELWLRTMRSVGSSDTLRRALDAGAVRSTLHASVVDLLEGWQRPEPQPDAGAEGWLERFLPGNRIFGGPHCPICASKAASDPREWLCR